METWAGFFFWKLGPFLSETWAGKIFLETRVGFFLETWVWVQGRPACTCLPLMSFSHVAGVTSSDLRHSRELRKHCQCLNTSHPPLVDASSAHLPLWEQDLSCSPEWQGGGVLGSKPLKGPSVWMATAAGCSYLLTMARYGRPGPAMAGQGRPLLAMVGDGRPLPARNPLFGSP